MRARRLLLVLLILVACKRGEEPYTPAENQARTYARLRAFERPTLQSYASDKQLRSYLDVLAWIGEHGLDSSQAANIPRRPPPSLDDGHWDVGARSMLAPRSRAAWEESLPHLARHGDRVFFLRARELIAVSLRDGRLQVEGRLSLSEAIPPLTKKTIERKGKQLEVTLRDPKHYDGRVLWDALFADAQGLVLLGSCLDANAIEVVRVDARTLQRVRSYRVFFRTDDSQGYRVRWHDGMLSLFFQHDPLFVRPDGTRSYALPALQGRDDPAPRPLLQSGEVTQPLMHGSETRLHTMVRCDTRSSQPDCRARAVVGPSTLAALLAEDGAYVWSTAWRDEGQAAASFLYRLPTDMREPGAVRVQVRDAAETVRMRATAHELQVVHTKYQDAPLEVFRVQRALFTAAAPTLPNHRYRRIVDLKPGKRSRNDVELVGDDAWWIARSAVETGRLAWGSLPDAQRVPIAGAAASVIALGHDQSWFLPVGKRVLVSGSDSWNLHLSLVDFAEGRVLARDLVRDAKRSVVAFTPLYVLASHGDVHWVAQVHFEQTDATLRVVRVTDTLDMVRSWRLPRAHERGEPVGMEALRLDDHDALLRLDGSLLWIGLAPEPRLQVLQP